jgi:hypothetical protein
LNWGDYSETIPTKFGLIWFCGFREEDLNVKVYTDWQWTLSVGKISHGLWSGELLKNREYKTDTEK